MLDLKLLPRPKALDDRGPDAWLGDENDNVQFHLIVNDVALKPAEDASIEPAWRIGDVEALRGRMRALGIHFEEMSNRLGEPRLFVTDPQGPHLGVPGPA